MMVISSSRQSLDKARLAQRQTEILYGESFYVISFNLVLGAMLVFLLWDEVNHATLLAWLSALVTVVAGRMGLVLCYKQRTQQSLDSSQWVNLYTAGSILTGIAWGLCLPLFGPFVPPSSLGVVALWPCGITAGALATYALVKRVFFGLMIPALLPGIIYIIPSTEPQTAMLGSGIAVYFVFLSIAVLYINRFMRKGVELEWENLRLADDIKGRNEVMAAQNRDLEKRLETALQKGEELRESGKKQLQMMVERDPNSIAMLDKELRYLAVSARWIKNHKLGNKNIIGLYNHDVFPEIAKQWQATLEHCLKGITDYGQEERIEWENGDVDWINWEIRPWYDDAGEIGGLVIFSEFITEKIKSEQRIRNLQLFDELTGLPNQFSLQNELQQICESDKVSSFCLLVFEIRRFMAINSALGYEGSDRILKEIAKRAREHASQSDFVSRLGASVFAVIWPMMSDPYQAHARFYKFRARLTEPIEIEGGLFEPQIIGGLALYPRHGENHDILLRNATAARRAARTRRQGVAVYEPQHTIAISSLSGLADLRHALENNQFHLLYQPKLDLRINCISGAEALIRWHHPERGLIPPDHFIPLAEESGLITPITEWVVDTATNECAKWREEGLSIGISVNVSARDILEERFIYRIRELAKDKKIPIGSVTLEITESAVMEDPQTSLEILTVIRNAGLKLSMDDYGTGYSSMSYLTQLPIHELKIDKSFILDIRDNPSTMRIVTSTIVLGHELGLEVTAEGVEGDDIKVHLQKMGCDTAQGYGISKPLSNNDLLDFCKEYGKNIT